MDVQKELGKWKSEYVKCNTPEELADHKKRFRAFLQTLSPEDKKAFADKIENDFPYVINDEAIYRYKKSVCDDISNK